VNKYVICSAVNKKGCNFLEGCGREFFSCVFISGVADFKLVSIGKMPWYVGSVEMRFASWIAMFFSKETCLGKSCSVVQILAVMSPCNLRDAIHWKSMGNLRP
jgi:hypothetical protein